MLFIIKKGQGNRQGKETGRARQGKGKATGEARKYGSRRKGSMDYIIILSLLILC